LSILLITSASSSRFSSAAAGMPAASSVALAVHSLLVEAGRAGMHTPCTHCLLGLQGKYNERGLSPCLNHRGLHDGKHACIDCVSGPYLLTQQQRAKVPHGCSSETAWYSREACEWATGVQRHGYRLRQDLLTSDVSMIAQLRWEYRMQPAMNAIAALFAAETWP
jgi:hypothetical protein